MNEVSLSAQKREQFGKKAMKTLRRQGKLPAVVYGHNYDTLSLALDYREFEAFIRRSHGESFIIDLEVEGEDEKKAILKDLQRDPLKNDLLHADFQQISMTERLTATAPVILIGQPIGAREHGGVLEQSLRELTIECLPTDMPEHLEVDVSGLHIGDSIHVRDLSFPNIEIETDEDVVIAVLMAPRTEEEEEEVEELAEPELIGREGDKDAEDEDEASAES